MPRFEFHSLQELREFIAFLNQDKDALIKTEAAQLNQSTVGLNKAIDKTKEADKK